MGIKMNLNFAATLADQLLGTEVPAEVAVDQVCNGLKEPAVSPDDVDPKELEMGIEVEKEHTDDEAVAQIIALHHLSENPNYYSELKDAGLADELNSENEDASDDEVVLTPEDEE